MKLSFDFDRTKTAVIYADDDPSYMVGVEEEQYILTEKQRELQKLFCGIIQKVKQYNIKVNMDNLIEAIRDYVNERGITGNELGRVS